jgi:Ca2+-transporting ATPase
MNDPTGLTASVASRRLAEDGPNQLPSQAGRGLGATVLGVMREPMFLLLVAAGTLYMVMGEPGDAALLLGFVAIVMGITIVQERRTENALAALRTLASPVAVVVRDGLRQTVPAATVVRGDLVGLDEGGRVPADGILRSGEHLSIDESLLTGESVPVAKTPSMTLAAMERPGGDGQACVYAGTLVGAGQGLAEILATGPRTEVGRIGLDLGRVQIERTPLQHETGRMVRTFAIVGAVLCCIVVVAYAATRGGDAASWRQGLLAGITMAMAVLPEEFPVILAIFLALGAWRISRQRVLTRHLPAIESLGATTVLCTDKTGTLTRNQMTVARIVAGGDDCTLDRPDQPPGVQEVLRLAALASRPEPFDPMERAIHAAASAFAPGAAAAQGSWRIERAYALAPGLLAVSQAWTTGADGPLVIASKGAPEAIAGLCGLPPQRRDLLARQAASLAGEGLRVLGVATGSLPRDGLPAAQSDLDLTFVGLIALADPIREQVPAAIAALHGAGIRVVMITGDYPATAQTIARQAGIANDSEVLSGAELERLSPAELTARLRTVRVLARIMPEQKLRIVEALKADAQVVAMIGDGVNDATALKAAHVGIAMGKRGTDVARAAASLVLLDDDVTAIPTAVALGRRIFDNIKKAIAFTVAVHVPIAGLSILPVFIPGWPLLLLPVHIVFLELIIDPSCTLIFEAEEAEPNVMQRPPRTSAERLFSWRSLGLSLLQGGSALGACLAVFTVARETRGDEAARALTFAALVASSLAIIVTNRSWSVGLIGTLRTPNQAQRWVVLGTVALMAVVITVPAARGVFSFGPVGVGEVLACVAVGAASVTWIEVVKLVRRRQSPRTDPTPVTGP